MSEKVNRCAYEIDTMRLELLISISRFKETPVNVLSREPSRYLMCLCVLLRSRRFQMASPYDLIN